MSRGRNNVWGPALQGINANPGMINTPGPVRPSTDDDLEALALLNLMGKGVDRVNMDYLAEFAIPGYGKDGWLFGAPGNLFNKPKPPKKDPVKVNSFGNDSNVNALGGRETQLTSNEAVGLPAMSSLGELDKQTIYSKFNEPRTMVSSNGIEGDVDTPEEVQIMTTMLDNTKDPLKRAAIKAELQQASIRMRRV